jgi:hypothetical protein
VGCCSAQPRPRVKRHAHAFCAIDNDAASAVRASTSTPIHGYARRAIVSAPPTTANAQPDAEPSFASSVIVTFLPLVLLCAVFLVFLRFLRRANKRAEEAMKLARETVAELRAIRAAVERDRS